MTALAQELRGQASLLADPFDIEGAIARLCDADGGYEIVHDSAWLEIGVYALFAPEPDHERANCSNELYVALEGRGILDVEGEQIELREGHVAFIPAGANYRFSAYEQLSVLVICQKSKRRDRVQRSASLTSPKESYVPAPTRRSSPRSSRWK